MVQLSGGVSPTGLSEPFELGAESNMLPKNPTWVVNPQAVVAL